MADNNGHSPQLTISEIKEKCFSLAYNPTAHDVWRLLTEIERLTERAEKAEKDLNNYKMFWEQSREVDKMVFEKSDYCED